MYNKIKAKVISPGKSKGHILNLDTLSYVRSIDEPTILFSKYADTKAYDFLNKAVGIIFVNGGLFSHLSVMSRELNIPCVRLLEDIVLDDGLYVSFSANALNDICYVEVSDNV